MTLNNVHLRAHFAPHQKTEEILRLIRNWSGCLWAASWWLRCLELGAVKNEALTSTTRSPPTPTPLLVAQSCSGLITQQVYFSLFIFNPSGLANRRGGRCQNKTTARPIGARPPVRTDSGAMSPEPWRHICQMETEVLTTGRTDGSQIGIWAPDGFSEGSRLV